MRRKDISEFMQDVVGFGRVLEARQGASKSVELRISAHDGDAGKDWCEWWGAPTVAFLPAAGDEVMFVDLGSERVVIAVKSRQFQQDMETGECIVRAAGAPPAAYAKLKPDGTIELHGLALDIGEAPASFVALADLVATAITTAITGHTHASFSAPGVLAAPVVAPASTMTRSL